MGKVHPIPWHRKPLYCAFARSIFYREQFGFCAFQGPWRSKKAGEDEELYPFL